jgi:uncharacterized protein with HEPN domain
MRLDRQRLQDILEAGRRILEFAASRSKMELEEDAQFRSAVLYELLVIGEATKNLSDALKTKYPRVPWRALRNFRNYAAHEYFRVGTETVWGTISTEIPSLVTEVESIIAIEFP